MTEEDRKEIERLEHEYGPAVTVALIVGAALAINFLVKSGLAFWILLASIYLHLIELTYTLYYKPNHQRDEESTNEDEGIN